MIHAHSYGKRAESGSVEIATRPRRNWQTGSIERFRQTPYSVHTTTSVTDNRAITVEPKQIREIGYILVRERHM